MEVKVWDNNIEKAIKSLKGDIAIGHVRYSTTGASVSKNIQPFVVQHKKGHIVIAHNGNLTNALHLRHQLLKRGVGLSSTSDSEVITQMLAAPAETWLAEKNGVNGQWL